MRLERAKRRVFYVCLSGFLALGVSIGFALAKEYKPDPQDAFLLSPEKPVQRLRSSVPCLTPPEHPKHVIWMIRDEQGNMVVIGAIDVRQRC